MYHGRINKGCSFLLIGSMAMLLTFTGSVPINGQYATVKRITVETNKGVSITAWTNRQRSALGEEVIIFYEVANRSVQTIYLVRKKGDLETFIDGDALVIPIPLPFPEHGTYEYGFTRVQRGATYKGQLVVPRGRFNKAQTWLVKVNFGFVTDITGLNRKLRPNEDPAPLRGQLGERIQMVGVNGLVLEIE